MAEDRSSSRRLTAYVDPEVLDRARRASYWTPGLTLSALVEDALRVELDRLEAERGDRFPPYKGDLPRGGGVR